MRICSSCGHESPSSSPACERCGWNPPLCNGFAAYAPELAGTDAGFDPRHFALLASLEAGNFWFRARNELICRSIRKYCPSAERVLEVGCGTGFVLAAVAQELPHARLSGSELHTAGLSYASERVPGATLMQMDARRIPFRDEFDLVAAFDVIEHIAEDDQVLAQLHAASRRGGMVFITVPQHRFLWSQQDVAASHVRRYERGELEAEMVAAGFRVRYSTSFVSLLFPALLLSRKAKGVQRDDFDATSEFRIPHGLNRLLYAVMRAESFIISLGVRFPFGGSRLVVAEKEVA